MTTPRVTVPVEDLLFYKLKDLILEQSEGEWTDEMIVRDAHHFANHIRPLLSAAPAPEGGAEVPSSWSIRYQGLATREEAPAEAGERGVAGVIMDGLWPILGGNHTDAEVWNEIGEVVSSALRAQPPARSGEGQ